MTEKLVLVTGACGEIGQALVQGLAKQGGYRIVTADLSPLPDSIKAHFGGARTGGFGV